MLGPASGIKVSSLSYHLINSDDIHHHAVPLDRDSARQLRTAVGHGCWGVCRSMSSLARAKTEVAASWAVVPARRCVGLLRPQRWRTCSLRQPTHRLPGMLPGHTCPEHPNILQCLL